MTYYLRLVLIAFTATPLSIRAQNSYLPAVEALKLFNTYKPVIEKKNNAIVDAPKGQIIYAKEHECQPPYLKIIRQRKFAYIKGKIRVIL